MGHRLTLAATGLLPVFLLCSAGAARSSLLVRLTPEALAQQAAAIVVGTVTRIAPAQRSPRDGGLWTEIEVRVDAPVKRGRVGEAIVLTMPGGRLGRLTEYVPGTPEFRLGERLLLYVERADDGRLEPLGWRQGKQRIENGRLGRRPLPEAVTDLRRRLGLPELPLPQELQPRSLPERSAATPVITGILPPTSSANTGSKVTIAGANFGARKGAVRFPFADDAHDAVIVSWKSTRIECLVPQADSGGVIVRTSLGVSSAPFPYRITFGALANKVPDGGLPDPRTYTRAGTPDCTAEFAALDAAFRTWASVAGAYAHSVGLARTSLLPGQLDGHQVVGWLESRWPYSPDALAVTPQWYQDFELVEHDIALNGQDFTWSTTGGLGVEDVENVAAHEIGHWWGLDDLYGDADAEKTMYGLIVFGERGKRTLEPEDEAGLRWLYAGKPKLAVAPERLSFFMRAGAASPAAKRLTLSNAGRGTLSWWARSSADWISLRPAYGVASSLSVAVKGAGKKPGTYQSSVTIYPSPDGLDDRARTVPVSLKVSALSAAVSGLSAAQVRDGAAIRFTLTASATVAARVLTPAGRPVATIARATRGEAGPNVLLWNGRNEAGLPAPAGSYLLELTASDETGERSRAVTVIRLRR